MKLFAFYPKWHGEKSFFIMAKDKETAMEKVELYCKMVNEYGYRYYRNNGYYYIEEYDENEIAENDND